MNHYLQIFNNKARTNMKALKCTPKMIQKAGKQKSKKRLVKILKAVKDRDESILKNLQSPSMWD